MSSQSLPREEFALLSHLAKEFVDRGVREWRPEELSITRIALGMPGEVLPMMYALAEKGLVQVVCGRFQLTAKGQLEARELVR